MFHCYMFNLNIGGFMFDAHKLWWKLYVLLVLLVVPVSIQAEGLASPKLVVDTQGYNLNLAWTEVSDASGYQLVFAPYPYVGAHSIGTLDVGMVDSYRVELWEGADYYVAVQAKNGEEVGGYSNIERFTLTSSEPPARNVAFLKEYLSSIEKGDKRPVYALYAANLIGVPRPEIYLKAGRDFLDNIASVPGSAAIFKRNTAEIMPGDQFETSGSSFNMKQIADNYEASSYRDLLPEGYPYLQGFDERLLPLSALLRSKKVSYLEKASIVYFYLQEVGGLESKDMFILYGAEEGAWIWLDGQMYNHDFFPVDMGSIQQDVLLVFNEEHCWYPMMNRDDSAQSHLLADIVDQLGADNNPIPPRTEDVASLHQMINSTYAITDGDEALDYLRLIAGHNDSNSQNYYPSVATFMQDYEHGYLLPLFREEIRTHANMLSPVSDYLSRFLKEKDWDGFESAFHAHNQWGGETWGCCIHAYTVDVGWRLDVGTCHDLSSFAAGASELAGLRWARIHGEDYTKGSNYIHFYVYLYEDQLVIDNGYVDDPGGNVYLTRSPYSGDATYSALDIFLDRHGLALFSLQSRNGNYKWANFFGSLDREDFLDKIDELNWLSVDGISFVTVDEEYKSVGPAEFITGYDILSRGEYFKGEYP